MGNVSDKHCRENQNIFYAQKGFYFENRAVYEILRNVEKNCRVGQATNDKMAKSVACWITNATNTHSEY
jgi:hypothetical protein